MAYGAAGSKDRQSELDAMGFERLFHHVGTWWAGVSTAELSFESGGVLLIYPIQQWLIAIRFSLGVSPLPYSA
jgi:hypothetical protein